MKRPGLHELDYLLTAEAAAYCGVSLSQFKEHAPALGLRPFRFMGKVVYRKSDLKSVMESTWLQSIGEDVRITSAGPTLTADDIVRVLGPPRLLKHEPPLLRVGFG